MLKKIPVFFFIIALLFPQIFFLSVQAIDGDLVYRVAYIENFYPFQSKGETEPEGFVIDLLNAIAKEEKIHFIYQPMELNDAILALEEEKVDAIAGLKYTADLDEKFDFSEPFTTVSHSLIIEANNRSIKALPDLGGKTVAIERGDEGLNILRDIRKVHVIVANNQVEAFHLLQMGRAEAFLGNTLFAKAYIRKYSLEDQYTVIDNMIYPHDYAMAVKEGNKDLLSFVNHGLIKVRANQAYQMLYNKWFGWDNNELAKRLRMTILLLLVILSVILMYALNTIFWNRKLKQEVYNRTVELEETNQLLEEKIEEEKRLRNKLVYKEKMQTLGQLVAGIAHELRNPLTSIKTFVELIPTKFDNARFRQEIATYLPKEIDRLNQLVTNLLDYAKPQEAKKTHFSVKECLESVLTLFQLQLRKQNISLIIDYDPSLYIFADYNQTKQIMINLLLNATQAVDKQGEVCIKYQAVSKQVYITIEDTGKGISEEKLPYVFEPFYTDKKNRTGLGLSLSLQYIQENDGDLLIKSQAGVGTTVTVILPRGVSEQ